MTGIAGSCWSPARSTGIGRATAVRAADGRAGGSWRPCATPRSTATCSRPAWTSYRLDVTDEESVARCLDDGPRALRPARRARQQRRHLQLRPDHGDVDARPPPPRNLEVNFVGAVAVSRLAMPLLRAQRRPAGQHRQRPRRRRASPSTRGTPRRSSPSRASWRASRRSPRSTASACRSSSPASCGDTEFGRFPDINRRTIQADSGPYAETFADYVRVGRRGRLGGRRPVPLGGRRRRRRDPGRPGPGLPRAHQPVGPRVPRRQARRRRRHPHPVARPDLGRRGRARPLKETHVPAKTLRELVAFARRNSPFYADLYRDLPDGVEDLTDLPVIDQVDFWTANQWPDNRLLTGPLLDAGVYTSGGTTGAPKVSPWSRTEHFDSTSAFGAGFVKAGLKPGHRVANLFYAGHLYGGFLYIEAALHNAPVENVRLPVGGHVEDAVVAELIASFGVNVLAGTPMKLAGVAEAVLDAGIERRLGRAAALRRRPALRRRTPPAAQGLPGRRDRLARVRHRRRRHRRHARPGRRRPRARGGAGPHDRGDPRRGHRAADHPAWRPRPGRGHQPVPDADAGHPVPRRRPRRVGRRRRARRSGWSAAPTRARGSPTSRWRTSTCTPPSSPPTATA